jgi:hypothetical protein
MRTDRRDLGLSARCSSESHLSDLYGRRRLLLPSVGIAIASAVVFVASKRLAGLLLWRSVTRLARHHRDLADRSCRAAATVAVDFDGILHQKNGWLSDELTGDPSPAPSTASDAWRSATTS